MTTHDAAQHGTVLEMIAQWLGIGPGPIEPPPETSGSSQRRPAITIRARRKGRPAHANGQAGSHPSPGHAAACDVAILRQQCLAVLRSGVNQLEIDLTGIDHVDAALIALLAELMRAARATHTQLKIQPSLAVDHWLNACQLDIYLQPRRASA